MNFGDKLFRNVILVAMLPICFSFAKNPFLLVTDVVIGCQNPLIIILWLSSTFFGISHFWPPNRVVGKVPDWIPCCPVVLLILKSDTQSHSISMLMMMSTLQLQTRPPISCQKREENSLLTKVTIS